MADSQAVSSSTKDLKPSMTLESSQAVVQATNAPDGNTTIGRIVAFWKRISTRNPSRNQDRSAQDDPPHTPNSPSPELVVRSMDLLIMQAQVESYAKTVFQALLKCKVNGDKQNSS